MFQNHLHKHGSFVFLSVLTSLKKDHEIFGNCESDKWPEVSTNRVSQSRRAKSTGKGRKRPGSRGNEHTAVSKRQQEEKEKAETGRRRQAGSQNPTTSFSTLRASLSWWVLLEPGIQKGKRRPFLNILNTPAYAIPPTQIMKPKTKAKLTLLKDTLCSEDVNTLLFTN